MFPMLLSSSWREKTDRRTKHRPKQFVRQTYDESEDDEESTVGKLPPSDSEDEEY